VAWSLCPLLIRFTVYLLRESVPLFLKRQCDRTLGLLPTVVSCEHGEYWCCDAAADDQLFDEMHMPGALQAGEPRGFFLTLLEASPDPVRSSYAKFPEGIVR
jgi:hypothetical protein